jgi:hypothetical protein
MDWEKLDWTALERLREGFLSGGAARGPYWKSASDLANYDQTFGERIGWKWDAVLSELRRRGWRPKARAITDWGCGSGIAGRRVLEAFGSDNFDTFSVFDHSPLACDFAIEAARLRYPRLRSARHAPGHPIGLLVVSHVLNELSPAARQELLRLARTADGVIWVEPGTHAASRDLINVRQELLTDFRVVAPCTHQANCGLLAPGNERHWCHGFASPPASLYADSDWVKFGQRAGIDLRSLPYSFLVLERISTESPNAFSAGEGARIIGSPQHFKGYAKILSCESSGVHDLTLQKRDDPVRFKELKRESGLPLYRWERTGDRITKSAPLVPDDSGPTEI